MQIQLKSGKLREVKENRCLVLPRLKAGDLSKNAAGKLVQLCRSLDNGDFDTSLQLQVSLFLP